MFKLITKTVVVLVVVVVGVATTTTPVIASAGTVDTDVQQKSWTLFHKINGTYTSRGIITLKVSSDKVSVLGSTTDPLEIEYTATTSTTTSDSDDTDNVIVPPTAEDIAKSILSTPFYQLKLVSNDNDDNKDNTNEILASVPSCNVRRSNYRDEIVILVGSNNNNNNGIVNALSIQYIPKISPLAPSNCNNYDSVLPSSFNKTTISDGIVFKSTTIRYEVTNKGMSLRTILSGLKPPPGLKRIPGASSHRGTVSGSSSSSNGVFGDDDKGSNNGNNNQQPVPGMFAFFRKYWYIFGPLFIFNMFMGSQQQLDPPPDANEQQGSQQQQQQQQQQNKQEGTTPQIRSTGPVSSSSSASPGVKQRRGKRG